MDEQRANTSNKIIMFSFEKLTTNQKSPFRVSMEEI